MKNIFTGSLRYLAIVLGTAAYALGFSYFLYPAGFVTGGVTGIAMVINYVSKFPVGVMIILINIPIFIVGGLKLGWRFLISSAIGMVALSVMIDLFELFATPLTDNALLNALYGGVLTGFGLGVVFAAGATTGGTDIIAMLLRRRYPFLNVGQLMLLLDVVILVAYVLAFGDLERVMFSVVSLYLSTKVIDSVLYGFNYGKLAYIISDRADAIAEEITRIMQRGVTKLYGRGAYSNQDKTVLLCALKRRQIVELKRIVKQEDPNAFVILMETREVLGKGFENNEV